MVKTLERHRYALCEKHVIVPFCCSYQVYRYLAGCFGLISCRHYLIKYEGSYTTRVCVYEMETVTGVTSYVVLEMVTTSGVGDLTQVFSMEGSVTEDMATNMAIPLY